MMQDEKSSARVFNNIKFARLYPFKKNTHFKELIRESKMLHSFIFKKINTKRSRRRGKVIKTTIDLKTQISFLWFYFIFFFFSSWSPSTFAVFFSSLRKAVAFQFFLLFSSPSSHRSSLFDVGFLFSFLYFFIVEKKREYFFKEDFFCQTDCAEIRRSKSDKKADGDGLKRRLFD